MNDNENMTVPLACSVGTFTAEQQQRYHTLVASLHERVDAVEELPDGYAFRFPSAALVCREVMEFVTLERLCCPFLLFRLELAAGQGPLTLSLTGPRGAKKILAEFLWRLPEA